MEILFRNGEENLKNENEIKEKEYFIENHKKKIFFVLFGKNE